MNLFRSSISISIIFGVLLTWSILLAGILKRCCHAYKQKERFNQYDFFRKTFAVSKSVLVLHPIFWLVFLVPTIIQLLSLDSWIKWLFVCLLLIFLKAYRNGYTVHKYLTVDIVVQLIIACLFGLF